jgi:hypothetical protein
MHDKERLSNRLTGKLEVAEREIAEVIARVISGSYC